MPPETFNISDYFLDDRIREGRGDRVALRTPAGDLTYTEVQAMAGRFAHLLEGAGVLPEQRVLLALSDGPEQVAALFGTLKIGAVVVMVNPGLPADSIREFLDYTRAAAVARASSQEMRSRCAAPLRAIIGYAIRPSCSSWRDDIRSSAARGVLWRRAWSKMPAMSPAWACTDFLQTSGNRPASFTIPPRCPPMPTAQVLHALRVRSRR